MSPIPRPDHSARPLSMMCTYTVSAKPSRVFEAWTTGFECWFAQPGTLSLVPTQGQPYFFYNKDEWGRHPHYGRILKITDNHLIEMTWMTGNGTNVGTEGAETILRIELNPVGTATKIRLTHSGFVSEASHDGHKENWPLALEILNEAIGS